MKTKFLIFFFSLMLGSLHQAHAVFIKSELDERDQQTQHVTVYFAEREAMISEDNVKRIFNNNFTKATLQDGGIYQHGVSVHGCGFYEQINEDRLTKELEYIIGYSSPCLDYLKDIKRVNFSFHNISTKGQLELLCNFMEKATSILYDISEGYNTRLKQIDINYAYWNRSTREVNEIFNRGGRQAWANNAGQPKDVFEDWIKDFKDRKKKIAAKK